MRPARQHRGLLCNFLTLLTLQRMVCAGVNRYLFAGCLAQKAGKRGPLFGLACDCADPQQLTVRVREEVGQADGIIHVSADVSIEQNFSHKSHVFCHP